MDKIQAKIDEINASIPEDLKRRLLKKKDYTDEYKARELAEHMLHKLGDSGSHVISMREQEKVRHNMERILNTPIDEKMEVDPEVAAEIDKYLDTKINKAIRSGELPRMTRSEYEKTLRRLSSQ